MCSAIFVLGARGMSEIIEVNAREILDSRGNPTVEVEVELNLLVCSGVDASEDARSSLEL